MRYFTIGTDPELFFTDAAGKPVPAHRILPGKDAKIDVDGAELFRDGWAAEINIPSTNCRETAAACVNHGVTSLQNLAKKHGYKILASPAVRIDLKDLEGAPEDVLMFGCEPSWDAYTGDVKYVGINALEHEYRYAGGHLHIGMTKTVAEEYFPWFLSADAQRAYVKLCDQHVVAPLTYWFPSEGMSLRRRYYGQAGEFRYQNYGTTRGYSHKYGRWVETAPTTPVFGVEIRAPGPEVWAKYPVAYFALGAMIHVLENFESLVKKWDPHREEDLRAAINTCAVIPHMLQDLPGFCTVEQIVRAKELWPAVKSHVHVPASGWEQFKLRHGI